MPDVSLSGVMVSGLLASPWVAPLAPPYLAWIARVSCAQTRSTGDDNRCDRQWPIVRAAAVFIFGFATVLVTVGAAMGMVGATVAQHFGDLTVIAGLVAIVIGLHVLGVLRLPYLAKIRGSKPVGALIRSYFFGLAFGFGWIPFLGPVLAGMLFLADGQATAVHGGSLLAAYSLGIGLPLLLAAALATEVLRSAPQLQQHLGKLEVSAGLLLVVTGLYFITGQMRIAEFDAFCATARV